LKNVSRFVLVRKYHPIFLLFRISTEARDKKYFSASEQTAELSDFQTFSNINAINILPDKDTSKNNRYFNFNHLFILLFFEVFGYREIKNIHSRNGF